MDKKQADDILKDALEDIEVVTATFVDNLIPKVHEEHRLKEKIGMDLGTFMDHAKNAAVDAVNDNVC